MNLSTYIGMVEHCRVDGTRCLGGVVDRSVTTSTTATMFAARAASEAPPVWGPSRGGGGGTRGAGCEPFAFRSDHLGNRPKARTNAFSGKEQA